MNHVRYRFICTYNVIGLHIVHLNLITLFCFYFFVLFYLKYFKLSRQFGMQYTETYATRFTFNTIKCGNDRIAERNGPF